MYLLMEEDLSLMENKRASLLLGEVCGFLKEALCTPPINPPSSSHTLAHSHTQPLHAPLGDLLLSPCRAVCVCVCSRGVLSGNPFAILKAAS